MEATMAEFRYTRRASKRPAAAHVIWAMPSACALLVASLLTQPPYGCLGPSGNDRYRNARKQWGFAQVNCQVAAAFSQ